MRIDYLVVGAGPAGAYFAREAAKSGYSVVVLEQAGPGFKACGGAIPVEFERDVGKVPSEAVITEVHTFRVYLDGRLLWEVSGRKWGYFVDKRLLLEKVLEGVEVVRGVYDEASGRIVAGEGVELSADRVVLAIGPYARGYSGDRVYALQAEYHGVFEEGVMTLYFDSSHVGYYWVFPVSSRRARIGVGGYKPVQQLLDMLEAFARRLRAERVTRVKAAPINVGGVPRGYESSIGSGKRLYIGEAAGFVYPLTGEGIRPAALSAILVFKVLEGDAEARKGLERLVKSVNLQRTLLEFIMSVKPSKRAAFMQRLKPEEALSLALGDVEKIPRAVKLLASSRLARLVSRLL